MWSGPRNISTAMMRAFENRPDCAVIDEPFYAAYLAATGLDHPLRAEVLASQPTDWRKVVTQLTGPVPDGRQVFYQKHMTHHMLADFGLDWMASCRNVFLIRAPQDVLRSYRLRRQSVTLDDLGFVRQAELFDAECDRLGVAPPVIDAADVLAAPGEMLTALCERLGILYLDGMTHWPAGRRPTDGVWAPAWYEAVERSTGFGKADVCAKDLARVEDPIVAAAWPLYQRLSRHRLMREMQHDGG